MKRKVVQIAGFTKVVSLPSQWVKKHNIQKGMELELREEGDNMIVQGGKEETKTANIDLRNTKVFLRRFIDIYYRLGYDVLHVKVPNEFYISLIQKEVSSRLLGFEIVDQKTDSVTIRSISRGIEEEFKVILRRMFLMLNTMSKEGLEIIKSNDYERLKDLIDLEEINNKFTNFCQRALNKHGHVDHKNTNLMYNIVCTLEQMADNYAEVFRTVNDNPKVKLRANTLKMYAIVDSMLIKFNKMFYTFKLETLMEFDKEHKQIVDGKMKWFGETKNGVDNYICNQLYLTARLLHHLSESLN